MRVFSLGAVCLVLLKAEIPIIHSFATNMAPLTVRPVQQSDIARLKDIIDSNELFPSEMLDGMVAGYFHDQDSCLWMTVDVSDEQPVAAVAYCAPEPLTDDKVWNLYLLAVAKNLQGQGIGTRLVQAVEEAVNNKARILLVETSGTDAFARTREFYTKLGFVHEGTIRDYYDEGDDKIIFWKKMMTSA
jgi:ribosomal protein S18 acetylase RimI-like enzyme